MIMSEVPLQPPDIKVDLTEEGGLADTAQKVFTRSFCKSQFPHQSVMSSLIITATKKIVDEFERELTFLKRI